MRSRHRTPISRSVAVPIACAWMALCAIHFSAAALADTDAHAIRSLIGATWDKPEAKVETDPVVVSGDFAVASWTQGGRGGRALLRRVDKGWSVVLCSGDPLKAASSLVEAGVPIIDADRISKDLAEAEAHVAPERRALFALFEGTVPMNGPDDHQSQHKTSDHR